VPLLPLLFEKLLGRSLDLAPWGVPVIGVERGGNEDGGLEVTVALHSPPPAEEGLFEVGTPLGPVTLRLDGLRDTRSEVPECAIGASDQEVDKDDQVLVISLSPEWLEPSLLSAAWDEKTLEIGEAQQGEAVEAGSGAAWRAWLGQWGELSRLELSAHIGDSSHSSISSSSPTISDEEVEPTAVLAASFTSPSDRASCAAALGEGRLLVLQDPQRAAFTSVRCMPRKDFEEAAELAWREHVLFKQEISRIDRAQVLAEARDAVPTGSEACFRPLLELLERWVTCGALHATSTVCAQRRLQESDASARGKAPDLFRRACWHSAFRVVLQIRSLRDTADTLALALSEHWRKTHGICLDVDIEELEELLDTVQEVWMLSGRAEDAQRRSAEAEAETAERALLEELDAEESSRTRDRKKREKKHQKERQRRKDRGSAKEGGGQQPRSQAPAADHVTVPAPPLPTQAAVAAAMQVPTLVAPVRAAARWALAMLYHGVAEAVPTAPVPVSATPGARRPNQRRAGGQQRGAGAAAATGGKERRPDSPPARRPADIEAILEAVRKSEELRPQRATPAPMAATAGPGPVKGHRTGVPAASAGSLTVIAGETAVTAAKAMQVPHSTAAPKPLVLPPMQPAPATTDKVPTGSRSSAAAAELAVLHGASGEPLAEEETSVSGAGTRGAPTVGDSPGLAGAACAKPSTPRSSDTTTSEAGASELELSEAASVSEVASSHEGAAATPCRGTQASRPAGSAGGSETAMTCATPLRTNREVVTWGDLGDSSLLALQPAPTRLDAIWADCGGGPTALGTATAVPGAPPPLLATVPSPRHAAPRGALLDAGLRAEGLLVDFDAAESSELVDEELPMSPTSPMSAQSKSARCSHRRRRHRHEQGSRTCTASEASTVSGAPSSSHGSPGGEPSPSGSEADALGSPGEAPALPQLPQSATPAAAVVSGRSAEAAAAPGPSLRRNVVTLSDLGLDLAAPAGGGVTPTQVSTPPALHTGPPAAADAWVQALGTGWAPLPAPPAPPAWSPEPRGCSQDTPIMRTYPAAGPCPWSAAAAGEASQRSFAPTPAATPVGCSATAAAGAGAAGQQGDAAPLLRSWLFASGLPSSGADLAEQLRAVAPESYED